jgi:hypothetical protein
VPCSDLGHRDPFPGPRCRDSTGIFAVQWPFEVRGATSLTGDELGYLLPDSVALQRLQLAYCNEIICLKIPHVLQRLSCLDVAACHNLQVIKSEAPNLSCLCFEWFHHNVHISLGDDAMRVKKLQMLCFRDFYYVQLPTIMPNLEILTIDSSCQVSP